MILAKIRNHEEEKQTEPTDRLRLQISPASQVMQATEYVDDPNNELAKDETGKHIRLKVKLTVSYEPGVAPSEDGGHINNLTLTVRTGKGVKVDVGIVKHEKVNMSAGSSTPIVHQFWLYPKKEILHFEQEIQIAATYQQSAKGTGGNIRSAVQSAKLPMAFFVRVCDLNLIKDMSLVKLNFVLNQACPSLTSIFEDIIDNLGARQHCQNKKQIGFLTHTGEGVLILISKDDLKIRLQTNNLAALWIPLSFLVSRL